MESDPRVLVVADADDQLGSLCEGLDRLGWRTVTARSLDAALLASSDLPVDAAVVDLNVIGEGALGRLRDSAAPRYLSILGIGAASQAGAADCDLVFSAYPHPLQMAPRLEQLTRAAVAEEEFMLRQATFAAHGVELPEPDTGETPLQILTAGAADRRFLALSNALTAAGAEAVAAPTPYTAFDYLHERAFDAAVLWGDRSHAPALSIAAGMRRNTRLYHIPLTLYLREETQPDLADLFGRGFADVAAAATPEEETAERVLALARNHRRRQALRRALDAVRSCDLMDAETGLFSRDLFAAHLARIAKGARARNRPLSVCVLRVPANEAIAAARQGGWLERAMPQIGAMVSRLVRVEDTAARLSPETFALALPATDHAAARTTAERIAAVIACTAFDAGRDRSPFVVELDVGVAELRGEETPASLLERASADLPRS
ncbi:diguanylate cyclase [Brevundimonas naejangsanensis]|uniref:Diguanylate cyclase n=1 Tax=Brevundimonas naejangsanensis TaxID=588932 RepID=A0A494RQX8_9CAUL|nr:diguanylate cyclase [Brevundimonas naejangsanensis]AYG95934.1 diguanylate cyclase [Brevundimonas naejangsanensis]